MASKVVFIRVNPTIYPIDHIAVNHIALDSIPHGSSQNTTWIVFHTTISHKYQPIYFCILNGWWFINIHVHTYFTERIWQVTCFP